MVKIKFDHAAGFQIKLGETKLHPENMTELASTEVIVLVVGYLVEIGYNHEF